MSTERIEELEEVTFRAERRRWAREGERNAAQALAGAVVAARDAGHTVAEIASAAEVTRQAIYDFMRRHKQ